MTTAYSAVTKMSYQLTYHVKLAKIIPRDTHNMCISHVQLLVLPFAVYIVMALKLKKKDLTIEEKVEVIKTCEELGDNSEQPCTILLSVSLFIKKYVGSKNSIMIYYKQPPLNST